MYQEKADQLIAQGALTNSKRPSTFVEGVYPTHVLRGNNGFLIGTTGRMYLDFICGLGCNLLGYAERRIHSAIVEQLHQGATLSLATPLELDVAERITDLFPFVESVKFLKTGTEACMAAVKIARAATGRHLVLSDGYHGWSDGFVSLTAPAIGVPPYQYFKQLAKSEDIDPSQVAAIIVEPVITDFTPARREYLAALRAHCSKHGIMLIFDEVITGFRFLKFSVASYWEIEPDLICLGKAIANGMPLSVVGGRHQLMNAAEYFVSSTFAGEGLSLAAARCVMSLMKHEQFDIKELWRIGASWLHEFNSLWPEKISIEGYPTRGRFVGDPEIRALFFQEACDRDMLFGPSWFFNFPLAKYHDQTLQTCKEVICRLKQGNVVLRGKAPQSPFAEKVRTSK